MSLRSSCHDNAVAEIFFSNLKKEKIRQGIYPNRAQAKQAVFHYIEIVYSPTRRYTKMIGYRQKILSVNIYNR